MVFSSLTFLFLFLPALIVCYFLPFLKSRTWKNCILLLFSLLFYAMGGLHLLPLLLFSIAINYSAGLLLGRVSEMRARTLCAVSAAVLDLGLLVVFKYLGFFTLNLQLLFPSIPAVSIVLPIGISFYTFQGLSYVLDVYNGTVPAERNPLRVALYVSLFPQLVAGPIVRYTSVAQDIADRRESLDLAVSGTRRFLLGLGKKVLIANQMGLVADFAFAAIPKYLSTGLAWLGLAAYTLQIYFDFSGYSDMAIGLGRIFGFSFPENFNYPYCSRSVTEFWRRWHISLSSWFRDYLYIPLGGNRVPKALQIRNLLLVWLLTGFWHGAAWNFVLWGLYYAALLIGERFLWGKLLERAPRPLAHLYAMLAVMVGWVIFRADSAAHIAYYLRAMFGFSVQGLWSSEVAYFLIQYRYEFIIALLACLPLVKLLWQKLCQALRDTRARALPDLALSLYTLGIGYLAVTDLIGSGYNPFIYFQF